MHDNTLPTSTLRTMGVVLVLLCDLAVRKGRRVVDKVKPLIEPPDRPAALLTGGSSRTRLGSSCTRLRDKSHSVAYSGWRRSNNGSRPAACVGRSTTLLIEMPRARSSGR